MSSPETITVELDDDQDVAAAVIVVGREGSLKYDIRSDLSGVTRHGLASILRAYADTLDLEASLAGEG